MADPPPPYGQSDRKIAAFFFRSRLILYTYFLIHNAVYIRVYIQILLGFRYSWTLLNHVGRVAFPQQPCSLWNSNPEAKTSQNGKRPKTKKGEMAKNEDKKRKQNIIPKL